MTKEDFKKIVIHKYSSKSYTIKVKTKDGGQGLVDIDFNDLGDIKYFEYETYKSSFMFDMFIENLYETCGIIDYCKWLGGKVKKHKK
jgi:hypothetical protein